MIVKQIIYFDTPCTLACDASCTKAWGINNRPRIDFDADNDPDDYAYLADHECSDAPIDPGTYEGGYGKPHAPEQRLNKWCARECERSIIVDAKEGVRTLPSFSTRLYNKPQKHKEPAP